jgi:hypothetical protein
MIAVAAIRSQEQPFQQETVMATIRNRLCAAILLCLGTGASAIAAPSPDGRSTAGIRLGDGAAEGFADFIVPLLANERDLVFFNPRVSLEDGGAQETNVGFGYRRLWPERKVILGGNVYYDSRFTTHDNQLNQYSLGLEFLSNWVDARANWYDSSDNQALIGAYGTETAVASTVRDWGNPYARSHGIYQDYTDTTTTTTTRRRFEKYETGLDGYDAEIGVRLPLPNKAPEARVFVGYYRYDNPFGEDPKGAKGRLEVRAAPYLTFDAEAFENDDLNGSNYFVGARLNLPFDLNRLAQGENPFKGAFGQAPGSFAERRTEMVVRDGRVQQSQSDYMENLAAKMVDTQITTQKHRDTLLKDTNFVNNGNKTGKEDGTAEHPYNTIQEGVDNVFGQRHVYVFGMPDHGYTPTTYFSNVVLTDGIKLIGSGYRINGNAGRSFGGSVYPTVNGRGLGPVIALGDSNQVTGFHLVNLATGTPDVIATLPDGDVINVARSGIFGNGVQGDIVITGNTIRTDGGPNFSDWGDAVLLQLTGPSNITIANNTIDAQGFDTAGITVETYNDAPVLATISDNTVSGGIDGIYLDAYDSSYLAAVVKNNTLNVTEEFAAGIDANVKGNATLDLALMNNTIMTTSDVAAGIYLYSDDSSKLAATISGNTISTSGDYSEAIYMESYGDSQLTTTISGNTIATTGIGSDGIDLNSYDNSQLTATIADNQIMTSLDTAITMYSDDASTLCGNLTGNALNAGGGNEDIKLYQFGGSMFNIVDYPNLGPNNGGASVNVALGAITNVAGCQ